MARRKSRQAPIDYTTLSEEMASRGGVSGNDALLWPLGDQSGDPDGHTRPALRAHHREVQDVFAG